MPEKEVPKALRPGYVEALKEIAEALFLGAKMSDAVPNPIAATIERGWAKALKRRIAALEGGECPTQ